MLHHPIFPVDECRNAIGAPDEIALVAFLCSLEYKAHPGIIAFALNAIEAAPTTFEPHMFGLTQTHPIHGVKGSACQCLRHGRIKVIRQPTGAQRFGVIVHRIFGKAILLTHLGEGRASFLLLRM